jgi:hypothetical protein
MTSFALNYTRVQIASMAVRGQPHSAEQQVTITLTVAMEENSAAAAVDQAALHRMLLDAFMAAAGGRRTFRGRTYRISFALSWVPRGFVETGRALGVRLATDASLVGIMPAGGTADGVFEQIGLDPTSPTERVIRRVILLGDAAAAALHGGPGSARARIRFANSAVHETIGHALGLPHREGTAMGEVNDTHGIRRLTNIQVLTAVENLLST